MTPARQDDTAWYKSYWTRVALAFAGLIVVGMLAWPWYLKWVMG